MALHAVSSFPAFSSLFSFTVKRRSLSVLTDLILHSLHVPLFRHATRHPDTFFTDAAQSICMHSHVAVSIVSDSRKRIKRDNMLHQCSSGHFVKPEQWECWRAKWNFVSGSKHLGRFWVAPGLID